jgi:hypothetical protein
MNAANSLVHLDYSTILKLEAASSSETSANIHQNMWRYVVRDNECSSEFNINSGQLKLWQSINGIDCYLFSTLLDNSKFLYTTSMVYSILWASRYSDDQYIPRHLCSLNVHYHVHEIVIRILSQINVNPNLAHSNVIYFNIRCLGVSSGLSLSSFPIKIVYTFLMYILCMVRIPAHVIVIYFINLIINYRIMNVDTV